MVVCYDFSDQVGLTIRMRIIWDNIFMTYSRKGVGDPEITHNRSIAHFCGWRG